MWYALIVFISLIVFVLLFNWAWKRGELEDWARELEDELDSLPYGTPIHLGTIRKQGVWINGHRLSPSEEKEFDENSDAYLRKVSAAYGHYSLTDDRTEKMWRKKMHPNNCG